VSFDLTTRQVTGTPASANGATLFDADFNEWRAYVADRARQSLVSASSAPTTHADAGTQSGAAAVRNCILQFGVAAAAWVGWVAAVIDMISPLPPPPKAVGSPPHSIAAARGTNGGTTFDHDVDL
jgi:hypothetical protein